jgi:hypothetical protein
MALGLGLLGGLSSPAHAQFRRVPPPTVGAQSMNNLYSINPNPVIAPGLTLRQAAYNTAVVGQTLSTIPPYLYGYNPYPQSINYGPSYQAITPYAPPYALSAGGGGSPYAGNPYYAGAALSTSPYGAGAGVGGYGLSTTPGGLGSSSAYGTNPYLNGIAYGGAYGGSGLGGNTLESGGSASDMYGQAALIAATGDYYKATMQARITREHARQAAVQTRRMLIQEEAEYERMRPRAINIIQREQATDLAIARGDASLGNITSGRALNDLLRSINRPGKKLNTGPQIPLDEETLKNVNLSDPGFKGQVGMLKTTGKLKWPAVLQDTSFDEPRDRFTSKFKFAVQQLKEGEPLEPATVRDLRSFLKVLNKQVADGSEELSPSQYIEARRYLNQLDQAVRALDDPNVRKAFNEDWKAKGSTVAELVKNMKGLQFGPATPGEERAYTELYRALRSFEAGLQTASTRER